MLSKHEPYKGRAYRVGSALRSCIEVAGGIGSALSIRPRRHSGGRHARLQAFGTVLASAASSIDPLYSYLPTLLYLNLLYFILLYFTLPCLGRTEVAHRHAGG